MTTNPALKRVHVVISGRVQGVSFRAKTKSTAESLRLSGWVRNISDGKVEAVFEGKEQDVRDMLAWCHKGPGLALVAGVEVMEEPYGGGFDGFDIRY
jgi:acylphosphatase